MEFLAVVGFGGIGGVLTIGSIAGVKAAFLRLFA